MSTTQDNLGDKGAQVDEPKRRGRPPGSKNKQKKGSGRRGTKSKASAPSKKALKKELAGALKGAENAKKRFQENMPKMGAPVVPSLAAETCVDEDDEPAVVKTPQRLGLNVKIFIVTQLAWGHSLSEVAKNVETAFEGVKVTATVCERYDPTKASGRSLSLELRNLFWRERKEFERTMSRFGRGFRMARLVQIIEEAHRRGAYNLEMKALEQLAKEEGGLFTNKSKVEIEDKRAVLAQMLGVRPDQIPSRYDNFVGGSEAGDTAH